MKFDIILSGVGGQGVLSVAGIIATAAMMDGYMVRQSEVHGMAQRGGAVQAHMRISDETIESDLIGKGTADMILSMEPLESLRYLDFLSENGSLITSSNPFKNIPDYPEVDKVVDTINSIPAGTVVDAEALAKEAGSVRATNMVMVGAASEKLPVKEETILKAIENIFMRKGEKIVNINNKAFNLGKEATGK